MRQLLIILFLVVSACANKPNPCQDLKAGSGQSRLITFGDSQTAGNASPSSLNCGYSWANIVSLRENLTLDNQAVPGSTFVSKDEWFKILTYKFEPTDRVAMMIGFNDMKDFDSDQEHLDQFQSSLESALEHLSPKVREVVILDTLRPFAYSGGSEEALLNYRRVILNTITSFKLSNVRLISNVGDGFASDASYYNPDETHLNVKGQTAVADLIGSI